MKNIIKTITLALSIFSLNQAFSQDTLHLDFGATQTAPDKAMEDKIVAWGKTLNGKKQDINIIAYYHKGEFKKFAEQRVEEMFLSVNRKVRDLVTIKTQEAQKGENYQRTRVDIIYWAEGSDPKTMADKKKAEEKAAKDAEKKKKEDEEKLAKEAKDKEAKDKKGSSSSATASKDKKDSKDGDKNGVAKTDKQKKEDEKKQAEEEKKALEARQKERWAKYGTRPIKAAGQGDVIKDDEVKRIKESKLIVAEFGNKDDDEGMLRVVKKFWTFTSDVTSMPYKEAKELAKKDEKVLIIFITSAVSKSLPHDGGKFGDFKRQYKEVSSGAFLAIETGKGNVLANTYIPTFGGGITEEILVFGISNINCMLKTMDEKNLSNGRKLEEVYKASFTPQLKEKTLYVLEDWMDEKCDKAKFASIYSGKFEMVSYEKWSSAILNKEDVSYVIIAPRPIGGAFMYIHYLMDAKDGMVRATCAPKVVTKNGKSNTGLINEANVKRYNDALSGDW